MASQLPAGYSVVEETEETPSAPALPQGYSVVDEPKEQSIANFAKGLATEVAVGGAGQALGAMTGPGYFVIAPASGAYGNYLKQQQEIERGERKGLSYGEMVASALINTIPGGAATKVGAKVLKAPTAAIGRTVGEKAARIGEQAVIRGTEGAVVGAGAKTVETAIEDKRWPTYDEYLSVIKSGGALGGAVGAGEKILAPTFSKAASKMWNRLSGKTQQEVSQELTTIRNTGTPEERQAAGEIIDEVGQRMGLVNPRPKSAEEAGRVLATEQPTFFMRSTGGRAEAVPGGFGSERLEGAAGLAPARPRAPEVSALAAGSDLPPARTSGQAEESARALVGEEAVAMAKREGRMLSAAEQTALRQRQAVEEARLAAEAAAQARTAAARGGFGGEATLAGSQPMPAGISPSPIELQQPPLGGFGGSGAESTPVTYQPSAAESALVFQLAEARRSAPEVFEQAVRQNQSALGAAGLRARLASEQQAALRAGDFAKARELEDIARQIEARRLAAPEQRPSQAAIEASSQPNRQRVTDMPTTEDIVQEFQNVPGVKGRAGVREMGLAGAGASVAAGVAEAMNEEGGATFKAPVDAYEIVHPDSRIGTLRYDAKKWNEDSILQDINKKEMELVKIDVAAPSLLIREKWQQIQDARDRGEITEVDAQAQQFELMRQIPIKDIGMATAARIGFPILGEALTAKRGAGLGRVPGAMFGEAVGSMIEGTPVTAGGVLGAGISAIPGGVQGQFAKNLMKFAGAQLGGEMTKEAIDRGDLLSFKQAAMAAGEGGAGAVTMKLMDKAARAVSSAAAKRGDWAVIKTLAGANDLGLIFDPTIYKDAWPKTMMMKVAGGSTKFQDAASRINYPRMTEAVEGVLGVPAGTSFDRSFFLNMRMKLGESYEKVAAVSKKASSALDDWKAANEAVNVNAKAASLETNPKVRLQYREAAAKARDDADKAFAVIQTEAYATGKGNLVDDLVESRKQLARMYAIKASVNEASGKIEYPGVWGEMYQAGVPFDGNLEKLARLSAIMPEVLQPPQSIIRQRPIKGASETKMMEGLSKMMSLPIKAGLAGPQAAALQAMMSQGYQRGAIMPSFRTQPGIPAQLGRFLGTEVAEAARPIPYR